MTYMGIGVHKINCVATLKNERETRLKQVTFGNTGDKVRHGRKERIRPRRLHQGGLRIY